MIVKEKKKECWKEFCKENSVKDLWEVAKQIKNLQRIREIIKSIQDVDKKSLSMEEERVKGLIKNHLVWNEKERQVKDE